MRVGPIAAPVRSQTVGNLRNAILTGRFAPGERLVEAELCRLLGVSRPSVREALRQLEAERLVVITPFKGPAVARIDWPEAEQIYEVRALLEGQAGYLFAARASKEQIAAMSQALKRFEEAARADHAESRLLHTDEFYNVMLNGCGNAVIADLLTGVHARINFLRARSMSQQGRSSESVRELRRILNAIAAGDAEKARDACIEHVRRAASAAKASFGKSK
jgi:DNA-binding GntR family transcriptional regulator